MNPLTIFRPNFVLFAVLMLGVVCTSETLDATSNDSNPAVSSHPTVLSVSPEIDSNWRYTKHGWQDISNWTGQRAAVRQITGSFHPFAWAATVLILVIATMIWASSEWDFERLFRFKRESEKSLTQTSSD